MNAGSISLALLQCLWHWLNPACGRQTDPAEQRANTVPLKPLKFFWLASLANITSGMRKHPYKWRSSVSLLGDRWDPCPCRLWNSFFNNHWLRWDHPADSASDQMNGDLIAVSCATPAAISAGAYAAEPLWRGGSTCGAHGFSCSAVGPHINRLQGCSLPLNQAGSRMLLTQGFTGSSGRLSWGL